MPHREHDSFCVKPQEDKALATAYMGYLRRWATRATHKINIKFEETKVYTYTDFVSGGTCD